MKTPLPTTDLKKTNRIRRCLLPIAALILVLDPALADRTFRAEEPPPAMPESMPPLPQDQKPAADEPMPTKPPAHAVAANEVQLAETLFKNNGLDLDNLRITRVISVEHQHNRKEVIVHAQQLYHHLPVEGRDLVYVFRNGEVDRSHVDENARKRKELADLEINLAPAIARWQAVEGMRRHALLDPMVKDGIDGQATAANLVIFNTEKGHANPPNYVLAWRAHIGREFPYAIIDATSGKMLFYDNGIRL